MTKEERSEYLAEYFAKGWSRAEIFACLGIALSNEEISVRDFYEMSESIGFPIAPAEEDAIMDSVGFYRTSKVSGKSNKA